MEPGDYLWNAHLEVWMVMTPNGMLASLNTRYELVVEADGSLTVSPSILVTNDWESRGRTYHGYLERGIWWEV